ncbi:hypothetical protein CRU99_07760 [Malaciobacter mytili]|uniref:hypothetical protein n=1 Tax=Malaciobacter mytili TaxID=603050 RepID=UPI00100B79AD|nr:hypothetical protein [Malaciobacter mytili]RXI43421.1 hypothetical protein CRU99_07760 [Malaciobacter mytili]
MKKLILILFLIFTTSLLASSNNMQKNIIDTSGGGKSNVSELDGEFTSSAKKEKDYTKEILLNYMLFRENINFSAIDSIKKPMVVVKSKEDIIDENKNKNIKLVSVRGYCIVEETVDIGKQPMSANLNCNTNIGAIKFFGNYVPHNKLETLFVTGLHIEKNTKKYKIENAKILNESRTSYNVATYVNSNKLEKSALKGISDATTTIESGANDYLKQLEASKKVQEASTGQSVVDNSGSGTVITQPVVTENTQPPEVKDYLVKGAIEIVARSIRNIADIVKEDLPYYYQIVAGSKLYVDLYVNPNEMSLDSTINNNINDKNYTTLQGSKK